LVPTKIHIYFFGS
jgi:3,4-dihydroxy 2-butanone 4-phosphate synthase / GTP cyclohydrolase II